MFIIYIIKNSNKIAFTDHFCKKIGNQLISLKIRKK